MWAPVVSYHDCLSGYDSLAVLLETCMYDVLLLIIAFSGIRDYHTKASFSTLRLQALKWVIVWSLETSEENPKFSGTGVPSHLQTPPHSLKITARLIPPHGDCEHA
ncbi:hypothetical protein L218DRAFT_175170 [Marasmius fiardii PR-910]|nr:hypothetical protein L218DRAFT_175170 [Marasmius fiardii PR-910]